MIFKLIKLKRVWIIASLIILIAAGIFLYSYFSSRKSIQWYIEPLEPNPVQRQEGRNECRDIIFLNEILRNFEGLTVDSSLTMSSFRVNPSTISVMSGKVNRERDVLQVSGEKITLGLWGCGPLIKRHMANILELSCSADKDIIIDTFSVYPKSSMRMRARELVRQLFLKRYGSFVCQVILPRDKDFQAVSINLGTRVFQKPKHPRGIIIQIISRDKKRIMLKIKDIAFHPEVNSILQEYPSLGYFKNKRQWIKSLFLPGRSRLSYTIHADESLVVDGYLGAMEDQHVDFRIILNGSPAVEKTVTGGMEYFSTEVQPKEGKILFEVEMSGSTDSAGILGNVTFRKKNLERKNIIYYLIDACRGDFGGVNRDLFNTHFQDGVVFSNAYANATKTADSLPVIFSGKYKFMLVSYPKDSPFLPQSEFLLAEYLKTNGYTTAAFVANPWLVRTNSHQGFDHVYDCWGKVRALPLFPDEEEYTFFKYGRMWEFLQDFVEQNRHKPLFIYIHTIEPHPPYELPRQVRQFSRGLNEELLKSVYGDFKERLTDPEDDQIRALYSLYKDDVLRAYNFYARTEALLKENGIINPRSLRILSADHGQRFFEHRSWTHGPPDVHNEVLRIPLMMAGRGIVSGIYGENVQLADIYPTIIHWLGDKPRKDVVGNSLLDSINGENKALSERIIYNDGAVRKFQYSFIRGSIKVIVDDEDTEIYDLNEDPGERVDLSREERFKALIEEARLYRHKFPLLVKESRRTMSDEERKRLKSLGYIK